MNHQLLPRVTVAVLNYNGGRYLTNLLPTAIREASRYRGNACVVILDNGSALDEIVWIQETFPSVGLWLSSSNDFLFSYNEFCKEDVSDVVIFLNNDTILGENFIEPLVSHFINDDVFSVSATSKDLSNTRYTSGPCHLTEKNGYYSWNYDLSDQRCQHTLFTSGGFMAVSRSKFLQLRGFSEYFFPAYCEDLDLSFRAWLNGWRCIFEPRSLVLHVDQGSWRRFPHKRLKYALHNSLLFQFLYLPVSFTGRIVRLATTSKLILKSILDLDFIWAVEYFHAVTSAFWIRMKCRVKPLSKRDLRLLIARLDSALESPLF
jgi:GT2 family glycosyltransferase